MENIELRPEEISMKCLERFPEVKTLKCEICGMIPKDNIVECNKCDKIFCSDCLDQYQFTEIKKLKNNHERRDEYNPSPEQVMKMDCPKYHKFYGFKPLEPHERSWGGMSNQQKPRKKLNQYLRKFVLE